MAGIPNIAVCSGKKILRFAPEQCKIKPEAADCELLQKLIESELSGGDGAVTEFDEYLKKEWSLFLETKQQIKVNWRQMNEEYKILSKLIVFDLVEYEEGEAAKGNDNVLKGEWISIFPAVHRVDIDAEYGYHFRLEALLDSMKALPLSVSTVTVSDWGEWIKDIPIDDINPLFAESGWNMERDEDWKLVFTRTV